MTNTLQKREYHTEMLSILVFSILALFLYKTRICNTSRVPYIKLLFCRVSITYIEHLTPYGYYWRDWTISYSSIFKMRSNTKHKDIYCHITVKQFSRSSTDIPIVFFSIFGNNDLLFVKKYYCNLCPIMHTKQPLEWMQI